MNDNPSEKKRILVICQHFWPETFRITDICEGLVESGYEVEVLCGIPNYPGGQFFKGYSWLKNRKQTYKGMTIMRAPEIPRGNNTQFRILVNYFSFSFFALFYVPKLLFRKYDRIMVYQLSPVFMALPGIILAKLQRKKLYIYIADFWPHSLFSILHFRNTYLRAFITRFSYWHYRQADGVMGAFKGIQTRLIGDVGLPEEKTLYVAQASEKLYEEKVHDTTLAKRLKGKFTIVFAGSINPAQSFETVVEAAEMVHKQGMSDLRYVIVGDGMSKKWLMEEVKKRGLDEYFVFEGFKPIEEIPKYQTVADALLVALTKSPLFEYGIPAKVQSYMASGKPLVGAMNGAGQALINEQAKCGICADSGDSAGLAKAILELAAKNPQTRQKLGQNGKEYYFRHFERNYNLNRLIEFVFKDNPIADTEFEKADGFVVS